MGEASGLACPAVDGDTDVHDVADIAEEIVQVLVRHLKRHVANEERLCGRVGLVVAAGTAGLGVGLSLVELADEVAALEDLHVKVVDGSLGVFDVLELDVSESTQLSATNPCHRVREPCSPSAQPPVIEDNLDVLDLTESREDALDLVGSDLVVQVANVDDVVGGRIALLAALSRPLWPVRSPTSLLEGIGVNGLRGIGRLGLRILLDRCKAVLSNGLSNGLGEVLRSLSGDLLLLYNIVTSESPLESRDSPLLLCAESGCECGDGARCREERLGGSCADGADGGAAEKEPGAIRYCW